MELEMKVGVSEPAGTRRAKLAESYITFLNMNMPPLRPRALTPDRAMLEQELENGRMLEEIIRNFESERRVKNILLVGLPSVGKSSLINSFVNLILGRYVPIADVGRGIQLTHTLDARRHSHFGITEGHLRGSPNEAKARRIHPHLPDLTDFIGLANENTKEMSEILSLQILGHIEPGIQITGLLDHQKKSGLNSLRRLPPKSKEDWKTDVVIFVHSVATPEVPKQLIECLYNIIRPTNTLRPVDVDFYVVLTKMDKVETGEVKKESVNAIENTVADLFGFHGFKEHKLFKLTNWCDDVGFPNSTAKKRDGSDKRSVILNNELLKLLLNISTPRADSGLGHHIQMIWFHLCGCITTIIRMFYIQPFGPRDILFVALFGLLFIIVVFLLISR